MSLLFKKQQMKRKTSTRLSEEGTVYYSSNSGDAQKTSDEILSSIQWLYQRAGKVVIEFIDDEEIRLTSLDSIKDDETETKLEEIKSIIKESLSK